MHISKTNLYICAVHKWFLMVRVRLVPSTLTGGGIWSISRSQTLEELDDPIKAFFLKRSSIDIGGPLKGFSLEGIYIVLSQVPPSQGFSQPWIIQVFSLNIWKWRARLLSSEQKRRGIYSRNLIIKALALSLSLS